ncbi:MAG: SUMF1/EgtB/PvdO family nonheme iron enzyme [Candidatus Delongbacteria bacterium]
MKTFRIFLLLVMAGLAFSAQFKIVKDVYEDAGSITAQQYGYKDHNDDFVAILKVKTDIEGLAFKSMTLDKSEYMGNGLYHVYMQPGSRMLEFMKTDFIPIKHQFPRQLESNKVYIIEVTGVGEEKKIEDITINILGEPENSIITFDGEEKGKIKSLKTSVGKHELKVTKDGFQTYTKTIEVSTDKTLFNYKLEKVEDAVIVIDSNPSGAMVYIDGVKIDKTPISSFYPAGTYKIKLTSDNYDDIDETIVIKGPETKKTYQLADIRATLTINTHEKAKVYLNGEQLSNYKNIKLPPQQCVVKVEMNKAKPLEERFILKKKENKTIDLFPQISTGTIQIAVIPTDAEIELSEDGGEKYTNTGAKSFSNVPVGTYKLKISKKGFKTVSDEIRLTADAIEKKSIKLEEGADVGGDYIFVQGGTFQMGGKESDEKPIHSVTVGDFYIGKTEVTQAQYQAVMGKNPSSFKGDNLPVESVTWNDAVEFCKKLSQKEGVTYRLPTEAEWEYAARGGNQSRGYEYSGSSNVGEVAWYDSNSGSKTHPVATKKQNELGIHDMSGNVWEWCSDWYGSDYYKSSPSSNPTGPSSGSYRVLRGGGWYRYAKDCRVAYRSSHFPSFSLNSCGFRVVRLP